MVKYKIEQGGEDLNSTGGISLLGKLLNGLKNLKAIDNMIFGKVKRGRISHSGIIKSMAGFLSLGKSDYTCIEEYRHDNVFRESLGLDAVSSEENLRQRLDEMSGSKLDELREANTEMLSKVEDFGKLKSPYMEYTPFDADVSPFDNSKSKKEGVSWTYKGYDGFAPMFGYVGRFGYMIGCEFWEGSQHSNKGALEFFSGCFKEADKLGIENLLSRLDSAYDAPEIYQVSNALGHVPIIDPNKRRGGEIELEPASKIRYRERSTVERGNSDLKDNYGARHIRVKGHWKVFCHLMFGVIAITVKQLFNMLN